MQRVCRKKLKHVIYVNGTRGKSSVTRMIDAGLRAGGFKVLSKTTGTLPIILHADGSQEEIRRKAPANIREQLRMLHLAAKENADILVVECMALQPENQYVSQHKMLMADIGVLTNVRLDHTDVMGKTKEEILGVLLNTMPKNGSFFTADADAFDAVKKKGISLNTDCFLALPTDKDFGMDFAENTALARTVCTALDVPEETALCGIRNYIRDPFSKEILKIGETFFVNALSANDAESTAAIANQAAGLLKAGSKKVLIINNRSDRPARTVDMCDFAAFWKPDEVYLLGQDLLPAGRKIKKTLPDAEINICRSVLEISLNRDVPTLMLAVGNIKGKGRELCGLARASADKEL